MLATLWADLRPVVIDLAGIAVAAFVTWLVAWLRTRFELEVDARHRDAFQTALTNAAGMLIARLGSGALALRLDADSPGTADGVAYVKAAVPDALARFRLSDDEIAAKVVAKLGVLAAPGKAA